MSVYDQLIEEFHHRKCAHADIYPGHYACSLGAHIFNLVNQETEVLVANAIPVDTRLHTMFVAPPGFSKCHLKLTKTNMANGTYKNIEDVREGDLVISLTDDYNIVERIVTGTIHLVANKIITIKTRSGRIISSTLEHPLRTIEGFIRADKLKLGERLAVIKQVPTAGVDYDENKLIVLAGLITEGSTTSSQTVFSQRDDMVLVGMMDSAVTALGGVWNPHPSNDINYGIQGLSKLVNSWGLRGTKSSEKVVPEFVFTLTPELIAKFLYVCYLGDGTDKGLGDSSQGLVFASASEQLRIDYQRLLARIGVIGVIHNTKVLVYATERDRLIRIWKSLGYTHDMDLNEYHRQGSKKLDVIPNKILEVFKEEFKRNRCFLSNKTADITKEVVRQIADIEHNDVIKRLCENVFWDEIIDISVYEGKFDVYDLRVDDTKTFVAEDISTFDTFWQEQYLRGKWCIMEGTMIMHGFEGSTTEAGFVGSASMSDDGDPVVTPGLAKIYDSGIVGFEEFSALTAMMKSSHSQQLDAAMLLALDRGYVVKRLKAGKIGYKTNVTVWAGTQPARFDLTSGLGRRFYYLLLIPTQADKELIRDKIRTGWGVRMDLERTNKIRGEIDLIKERIYNIKSVRRTPAINVLLDELKMPPYEEQLYIRLILGYKIITQDFNSELILDLDPRITALCKQEAIWRKAIRRGPEIAEIVSLLRNNGNQMPIVELRDNLMDFGIDWKKSSELIAELSKMKILVQSETNVTLRGKWE